MSEDLTDGWSERPEEHADLERSLEEIQEAEDWRSISIRARLLSYQCKKAAADAAFAAARAIEPETSSTAILVRKGIAQMFELEHELVLGNATRTKRLAIDDLIAAGDKSAPAARVSAHSTGLNASRDLYLGDFERAREQFAGLLEEAESEDHASRSCWLCGLAGAQENLGDRAAALVSLECAGWHTSCVDGSFTALRQAARMASLYIYFRRSAEADSWVRRLESLPSPRKTKRDIGNRAARLVTSSRKCDWLVVA